MASLKLEECGRVLITSDHRLYALDCFYCAEIFTKWDAFIKHMKSHRDQKPQPEEQKAAENLYLEDQESSLEGTRFPKYEDNSCNEVEYLEEDEYSSGSWLMFEERLATEDEIEEFESVDHCEESKSSTSMTISFQTTPECGSQQFADTLQDPNEYDNQKKLDQSIKAISKSLEKSTLKNIQALLQLRCNSIETAATGEENRTATKSPNFYEFCDFPKQKPQNFSSSRSSVKIVKPTTFSCRFCVKMFGKKKYLDVHERRHTKEYNYKCDYCSKRTATSSELTTHMRVHTGEKPYECGFCGKTFKTSSVLCQHQRKHEKPTVKCTMCPKSYYNNYQLKSHMNAHLNIRDYKCEFCSKAFTSAKILYSHKMNSHSDLRKTIEKKCQTNLENHSNAEHTNCAP